MMKVSDTMPLKLSNQIDLNRSSLGAPRLPQRSPQRVQDGVQAPWQHMCSSSVSVPACGSAHTCNRCVISASRPRRRCQHVHRRRRIVSPGIPGRSELMFYGDDVPQWSGTLKPHVWLQMQTYKWPGVQTVEFQDVAAGTENQTFHLCTKVWSKLKKMEKSTASASLLIKSTTLQQS